MRRIVALAGLLAWGPATGAAQEPSLDFLDVPARPLGAERERVSPRPAATRGLAELEGELRRFSTRSRGYRRTVDALLRRRERERRRGILARYASGVREERRLVGRRQEEAIEHLSRFVRRHPNEPRHTPNALLRLAELLVERATQEGREASALARTIEATRRIVVDFPSYANRDRAAYLLGWALSEAGRVREGVAAWRSEVCGNRFAYPPSAAPVSEPEAPVVHPALVAPASAQPREEDIYAGCRPSASPLAAEMWLRIGEVHFDASQLPGAIDAYRHVAEHPEDRLFAFGLYKLAWSHYRASHYARAVERFGEVVERSDEELRRTGRAGSELREEALQYIALTLAHDDWNEDGRPDHTQGGAHPLERLEDGSLWPRDRAWAPEIYRRVGEVLFEQAHADEAILAWRLRLSSFPASCGTPDVYLSIVRAHRQLGDEESALVALTELTEHVGPEAEWRAESCPGETERADRLVRSALASTARIHHRRAQRLRERARVEGSGSLASANAVYGVAVRTYRRFLVTYPDAEESYDLAFDLADALYWSGRWEEAAQAYREVRDSPLSDRHFARATRRVVESEARRLEADVASGRVTVREDPADAPTEVPEALRRLARAREIYLRWVSPERDEERVRDAYAFNNAVVVMRYGFFEEARRRFGRIFRARCRGPRASELGRDAWRAMRDLAARREEFGELERLASAWREQSCTFSPESSSDTACEDRESPAWEVCDLEARVRFRRLRDEAGALDGEDRRAAENVAARLVNTVDRTPQHEQSPAALFLAAQILDQRARRPASAVRVYQRIVDRVAPTDPALESIVAEAHFQLARAAERSFDYEEALASYAMVIDSERFARSTDPTMAQRRRDAMVNCALLTSRLGRHRDASAAWMRAADVLPGSEGHEARLRAVEASLRSGDGAGAARLLAGAGEDRTVRAHWLRARVAGARGDDAARVAALSASVEAFRAEPRRADLSIASRAALALADTRRDATVLGRIDPGQRRTFEAYVAELMRQIETQSETIAPAVRAYADVIEIERVQESVAALHRQGALYEALVRAVLGARFELPQDLRRRLRRAGASSSEALRAQLEDRVRARLDELVRPVECRAVERYAEAARRASRASLPTVDADRAAERLRAYGDDRVLSCLAAAHEADPSVPAGRPEELRRVRRGLHLAPPGRVAPGALSE